MSESFEAHVASGELALYVIDALSPVRKDAVEGHILVCEVCASRLAREACVEAALEEVARRAAERPAAAVVSLVPALEAARAAEQERAERVAALGSLGARRSRWAGGVAGALAAAAALVLAFASSRSEAAPFPSGESVAQRSAAFGDAAGDMSGALVAEVTPERTNEARSEALDGG